MKVALVHDYLNEAGGAERVLRVMADMYPQAPIYTAFAKNGSARRLFENRKIVESPFAWFLKIGRFYSYFRFLLPFVWRSIDLTDYDLVITSTSGGYIARGFRVADKAKVVAYCHTPPKWLYGYETPTGAIGKWWGKAYLWILGPFLRYFDYVSAQRVNTWVANSQEVANRVAKFYRRKATVVYPPVEVVAKVTERIEKKEYYLTVARVTGAKGLIEAATALQKMGLKLVIVGEVVERRVWQQLTQIGDQIVLTGRVGDSELANYYTQAKGYLALAKDEDFGMTVVEAMQCGTPVLALNSGGYKETVKHGQTGILIESADFDVITQGIVLMEKTTWNSENIKKLARRFGRQQFEKGIREVVGA